MTKKEAKIQAAKANRTEIIAMIEKILAETNSYMTLKTAMEVFLGAQVSAKVTDKDFAFYAKVNGYQAVRKAAGRATKKDYATFTSDAMRNQAPSNWR